MLPLMQYMSEESISVLVKAFDRFKSQAISQDINFCLVLDEFSGKLAKDEVLRRTLPDSSPSLWDNIIDTWKATYAEEVVPYDLLISLARFTRNLVAGVPSNQNRAYVAEPDIRRIVHSVTSFTQLEDETVYPLTRMLVQMLSNIVTLNDELGTRLWNTYTALSEDQNILARLLESPDTHTINATLVLILNTINADNQAVSRLTTSNGLRIVVRLLDLTEEWARNDSGPYEEEAFTIAYRLFESFLEQDLGKILFPALAVEDEPITPHQTSFLKLTDSYLRHQNTVSDLHDYSFLWETFSRLCSYSQSSIRRSLGIDPLVVEPQSHADDVLMDPETQGLRELDLRLPKVSAALVLLSQCLTTVSLCIQDVVDAIKPGQAGYSAIVDATQAPGFIESLIETLRLVDRFLPRIAFGQAVATSGKSAVISASPQDTKGFAYLKRDLVRLLGTICYGRRNIQNRIREFGGIQVVMNLCVIDERNPYLHEHALFALRNILHQNPDNQAIVEGLKPSENPPV